MAKSEYLLAVAGSGKTESIIKRCIDEPKRRLIVTYTTNGQREVENRLRQKVAQGELKEPPEVMGWYKFLIENFLKPYLPVSKFARTYKGFHKDYDPGDRAPRNIRYFDPEGRVGGELLGYVAAEIERNTKGLPISRLEEIFEEIVIDEAQDLAASDLFILERILRSQVDLYMVGDLRQIVYETTKKDRKYSQFRGLKKIDWIHEQEKEGRLLLTQQTVNYRSCQPIVSLANQVFAPGLGLEPAESGREKACGHHGIFYIREDQVEIYKALYDPMALRNDRRSALKWAGAFDFINFGECKGLQADHVLIFPTEPICVFLRDRKPMSSDISAARLYVALTRARCSVAFVMPADSVIAPGVGWW